MYAEEPADANPIADTQSEYETEVTSSFGHLIAEDITKEKEENFGNYGIEEVFIHSKYIEVASVFPEESEEVKIFAGIYDEETDELLTSGYTYTSDDSISVSIEIDETGKADVRITIDLGASAEFILYYSFLDDIRTNGHDTRYVKFVADASVGFGISITGSYKIEKDAMMGTFSYPLGTTGIIIKFSPKLVLSISGTISADITASKRFGYQYTMKPGGSEFNNVGLPTVMTMTIGLKGTVTAGIDFGPEAVFFNDSIVELSTEAFVGAEATVSYDHSVLFYVEHEQLPTDQEGKVHLCTDCVSGTAWIVSKLGVGIQFFDFEPYWFRANPLKVRLGDFYYSFDNHEGGFGKCSNWGKPELINSDTDTSSTDTSTDKSSDSDNGNDSDTDSDGTKKGTCKGNSAIEWELLDDGTMVFKGTGAIPSYFGTTVNNNPVIYDTEWTELRPLVKKLVIEGDITSIGKYSMQEFVNLTEIQFKTKKLTSIFRGAFHGCKSLTSVIIPDTVDYIDYDAFGNCINLSNVVLLKNLRYLSGFSGCKSLKSISIPYGTKIIESSAFSCSGLEGDFVIPESVYRISWAAFRETNITSITIPGSCNIAYDAFYGCEKLTRINYPNTWDDFYDHVSVQLYGATLHLFRPLWNFDGITGGVDHIGGYNAGCEVPIYYTNKAYQKSSAQDPEDKEEKITIVTKSYEYLLEGGRYFYAAVRSPEVENFFDKENLIHVGQVTADDNGETSFSFPIKGDEAYEVILFGPVKTAEKILEEYQKQIETSDSDDCSDNETPDTPADTDSDEPLETKDTPVEIDTTDTEKASDTDTSTETNDTPSDTDTASDVVTDTSTEIETDTDSTADTETDTVKESNDEPIGSDTDTEEISDTDASSDEATDTADDSENDTESESDTDAQTSSDTETDIASDTDTDDITNTDSDEPIGVFGDLDGDGFVTASDALLVLRSSLGLETLDDTQKKLADVNGDNCVDSADALEILRFTVGLSQNKNLGEPLMKKR